MSELAVLIAAAGRGTRAGLPYPKTLHPVQGSPILVRLMTLLRPYDATPTVIVSPDGQGKIAECLSKAGLAAHLITQDEPRGMGDAVLHFAESPAFATAKSVLLVWGDIPFLSPQTVAGTVAAHLAHDNDFTFATCIADQAYTFVTRDMAGHVTGLTESREQAYGTMTAGERDIGLFVFKPGVIHSVLREDLPGKFGKTTGEHGFLYIVAYLAARGLRIEALPIAQPCDLISLNQLSDLDVAIEPSEASII